MSLTQKITELIASVNNVMGVIDGKLRNKAEKSEIYTRTQIDDPTKTLGANAATSSKLKVTRIVTLDGDATGSAGFDGSGDVTLMVTVAGLNDKADKATTYTKLETDARIEQVIGSAPEALDTLNELAEALGNDPNFAATMTAELAKKADKTSVYTQDEANTAFVSQSGTAANAAKLGNNLPSHYATASGLESLEQQVGDAFTQLAQAFNDGADQINNIGA